MTDADRTDKAEERENMYIMMFTLQSLQNYGLSVKKTGLFVGMVSGVRGRKVSSVGKAAYAGVCKYGICT